MGLNVTENLDKRQLSEINKNLAGIGRFIDECDRAEQCGVDCQQRRADAEEIRQQLNTMKEIYFPASK